MRVELAILKPEIVAKSLDHVTFDLIYEQIRQKIMDIVVNELQIGGPSGVSIYDEQDNPVFLCQVYADYGQESSSAIALKIQTQQCNPDNEVIEERIIVTVPSNTAYLLHQVFDEKVVVYGIVFHHSS
jgi:hypothetical protein